MPVEEPERDGDPETELDVVCETVTVSVGEKVFVTVPLADEDRDVVIEGEVEGDDVTDGDGVFDASAESVCEDEVHPDDDGDTVKDVECVIDTVTVTLEQAVEDTDGDMVTVTDGEQEPEGEPDSEPVTEALLVSLRVIDVETVPVSLLMIEPDPDGVVLAQIVGVCVAHWDVV